METKSMVFKVYLGPPCQMAVITKVLSDFGLDATIYHTEGMWKGEIEHSTIVELVFIKVDPFTASALVHSFAGVLKFELKPEAILITRSILEDAQVI